MAEPAIARAPAPSARRFASPDEVERAEYRYYLDRLRPGHVVADIGANVGTLAAFFASLVGPGGRVYAFEPGRWAYRALRVVAKTTPGGVIRPYRAAVGDEEGEAELVVYDRDHQSWNGLRARPLAQYGISVTPAGREQVRLVTLDAFAAAEGIDRFDLVKIDVEGAELQVLLGARGLFEARRIGAVVFEFGQTTFDFGNTPDEIAQFFDEVGYELTNVVPSDGLFPGGKSARRARFAMHAAEPRS